MGERRGRAPLAPTHLIKNSSWNAHSRVSAQCRSFVTVTLGQDLLVYGCTSWVSLRPSQTDQKTGRSHPGMFTWIPAWSLTGPLSKTQRDASFRRSSGSKEQRGRQGNLGRIRCRADNNHPCQLLLIIISVKLVGWTYMTHLYQEARGASRREPKGGGDLGRIRCGL